MIEFIELEILEFNFAELKRNPLLDFTEFKFGECDSKTVLSNYFAFYRNLDFRFSSSSGNSIKTRFFVSAIKSRFYSACDNGSEEFRLLQNVISILENDFGFSSKEICITEIGIDLLLALPCKSKNFAKSNIYKRLMCTFYEDYDPLIDPDMLEKEFIISKRSCKSMSNAISFTLIFYEMKDINKQLGIHNANEFINNFSSKIIPQILDNWSEMLLIDFKKCNNTLDLNNCSFINSWRQLFLEPNSINKKLHLKEAKQITNEILQLLEFKIRFLWELSSKKN